MNSETQAVYDALAANQGKSLRESANFDSNRAKLLAALQTRMEAKLIDVRLKLARAGSVAGDKARQATAAAQAYARARPWQTAGVLIAAGAILGLVLSRRPRAPTDSTGQ